MKFVALMATGIATAGAGMLSVPAQAVPGKAGLANPASVYCGSIGGTSFVRKTPSGDVGYCRLPNGEVHEEWALFRKSQKRSPKRRTDAHLGNPAAVHCAKVGGTNLNRRTARGDVALCRLRNGKTVDAWDLLRGSNGNGSSTNGRAVMTNPAASYCVEQKGSIEVRDDANYCHLPNGRVVEEWKLFREQPAGRAR